MKTHNKLILSMLGSAFVVGAVSAQNWTLNGATQPSQLTSSGNESAVAIDPLTGVASVKTAGVGPSVTLNASSGSVPVNTSTNISWSASNFGNNLNCTRTSSPFLSGWSGSSAVTSGSVSVAMPGTPQVVTLTISCTGENGSASNSTNVTVTQSTGPVGCEQRPPAVNGSARFLVTQSFSGLWGSAFPGPFNIAYGVGQPGISDGTVLALEFVAPVTSIQGYLLAVYSPDSGGRGSLAAGFSECPGEINTMAPACASSVGKIRSEWTTTGREGACNLIPGRTYYYNISVENACVFGPDPGSPGGTCSYRLESKRYF